MFNGNDLTRGVSKQKPRPDSHAGGLIRRKSRINVGSKPSERIKSDSRRAYAPVSPALIQPPLEKKTEVRPDSDDTVKPGSVGSALASYFREVGTVPLLTVKEEIELAKRIKKGDAVAREHMIRANLRLVVKIAREYENLGLPLLDLISEGTIGLMKAVEKFDPSKGGKLSTYGSWWIKQQIRRALANQGRTIRLPVHVEGKLYRLSQAEVKLRDLLGREATD